jgi:hypothetical protein
MKDIHIFNGFIANYTRSAKFFPLQVHYNVHNFVLFKVTMGSDSLAYMTWAKDSIYEVGAPLGPHSISSQ